VIALRPRKLTFSAEQDLNSVERVDSYINLEEQERPSVIEGHRPPLSWPSRDSPLYVEDLHVRYHETLPDVSLPLCTELSQCQPQVLRGITFELKPREKVALVGRTGRWAPSSRCQHLSSGRSGKSTFSLALLRFIEARQGSIVIDGIDISTIGLSDLRKNIVSAHPNTRTELMRR
jgi:ABC-type multidrug transport system fused ATPase/permease subunit